MIYGKFKQFPDFTRLVELLTKHFENVRFGHQSEYHITISQNGETVLIDNFTSEDMDIRAPRGNELLIQKIILLLEQYYSLIIPEKLWQEEHEYEDI